MAANAKDAPTLPRGPFDLAPISSVTRPLSMGRRIPARRIPKIQRSRCGSQSRANRRGEKGQKSSTPVLWQRSISGWSTAAERGARKMGSGGVGLSAGPRLRRKKESGTNRLKIRAARREWQYVRSKVRKAEGPANLLRTSTSAMVPATSMTMVVESGARGKEARFRVYEARAWVRGSMGDVISHRAKHRHAKGHDAI